MAASNKPEGPSPLPPFLTGPSAASFVQQFIDYMGSTDQLVTVFEGSHSTGDLAGGSEPVVRYFKGRFAISPDGLGLTGTADVYYSNRPGGIVCPPIPPAIFGNSYQAPFGTNGGLVDHVDISITDIHNTSGPLLVDSAGNQMHLKLAASGSLFQTAVSAHANGVLFGVAPSQGGVLTLMMWKSGFSTKPPH